MMATTCLCLAAGLLPLAHGAGGFTPYAISTAASGASSVFARDLTGDGAVDVLSASGNDDSIVWYKNGGGSPPVWTPYNVSTTADGARCVYAADLNGDGAIDVLSASVNDDKIAWYRSGGGAVPSWTPYNISTSADHASSVFAADGKVLLPDVKPPHPTQLLLCLPLP
jgi:hypothetical protein